MHFHDNYCKNVCLFALMCSVYSVFFAVVVLNENAKNVLKKVNTQTQQVEANHQCDNNELFRTLLAFSLTTKLSSSGALKLANAYFISVKNFTLVLLHMLTLVCKSKQKHCLC